MSQLLPSNQNYSNVIDSTVSAQAIQGGVNEVTLSGAVSASAPVSTAAWATTVTVALSAQQLKHGVLHQLSVNPTGATTGDIILTRGAADIISDLGFSQVGDSALIKVITFGTAGANQNVQFDTTGGVTPVDILTGAAVHPERIAYVLLTVTSVTASSEAVSVTPVASVGLPAA